MVSYIREDLRLSRICEPLSSANGSDRESPDALEVVRVVKRIDAWPNWGDASWTNAWKYL